MTSLFFLGFIQFYSALFFSKYFEYTYHPYIGLFVIYFIQLISLLGGLFSHSLNKYSKNLSFLVPLSLLGLSHSNLNTPIWLIIIYSLVYFFIIQVETFTRLSEQPNELVKRYSFELTGGLTGIVTWYLFTDNFGYLGFFYLMSISFFFYLLTIKKSKKQLGIFLLSTTLSLILLSSPLPIIDKRERSQLVMNGRILDSVWEPNGHVEIIESSLQPNKKIISFEGGALRSTINQFDGDYKKLKEDFLNSKSSLVWSIDVVFPHLLIRKDKYSAALISCLGGQEILAARTFGAEKIDAIDINGTAQDLVKNKYSQYSGQIYNKDINSVTLDGRYFLEQTNQKYDVIQIYSADSSSFATLFGSFFRPSNLVTTDSLKLYIQKLNENGIFQLTQLPGARIYKTFEVAFGSDRLLQQNELFIYKSKKNPLVNFAFKKNGWKKNDIDFAINWLAQDQNHDWQIILNPFASESEKTTSLSSQFKNDPLYDKESSDDWPFLKMSSHFINSTEIKWIFLSIFSMLFLFGITFSRSSINRRTIAFIFFLTGITLSFSQSFLVILLQKKWGLPSLAICLTLISSLAISLFSNSLRFYSFKNLFTFFVGALLLATVFHLLDSPLLYLSLFLLMFCQSFIFSKIAQKTEHNISEFFWFNGLGFMLGTLFFNLIFVTSGLSFATWTIITLFFVVLIYTFRFKLIK